VKNIIKQVAKQNNVSVKEVKREIRTAIHTAMQSEDPNVRKRWEEICKNGKEPTPEELIRYISNDVCDHLNLH